MSLPDENRLCKKRKLTEEWEEISADEENQGESIRDMKT